MLHFGGFSSELTEYSDFIRVERSIDFFEFFVEIFYNMVVCLHDLKSVQNGKRKEQWDAPTRFQHDPIWLQFINANYMHFNAITLFFLGVP